MRRALASVVAGLIIAIAVAGALSALILYARRTTSLEPRSAYYIISAYYIKGVLVVVNPSERSYTATVLCENGSPVTTVVVSAPKLIVDVACVARWLAVDGMLVDVVVVLR